MSEVVEISKERLDALTRASHLLDTLWNDKDRGLEFKKMVKSKVPDARIPDLDLVETVTKPYDEKLTKLEEHNKKLEERLNGWETKELNAKEEGELQSQLNEVRTKFKFTDDGMKKVIDRMRDKKNPDAESAAAWVLAQEPKATPTSPSNVVPGMTGKMNLYGVSKEDADWSELNKNPQDFADNEIMNILTNPERYKEFGGAL